MVKVHRSMRAADLPAPSDLTRDEVDALLDPETKDVPELMPNRWLTEECARLQNIVEQGDEPERGRALVDLSMRVTTANCGDAEKYARRALEIGETLTNARVVATAHCALGWAMFNRDGSTWRTVGELALESEYQLHELSLPEWEANAMLLRMGVAGQSGQISAITGLEQSILELLRSVGEDRDDHVWLLAAARHALLLAHTALLEVRDEDLGRRYLALDVLLARAIPEPLHLPEVHATLARRARDDGRWSGVKRHSDRAILIAKIHDSPLQQLRALMSLGQGQVSSGDLDGAKATVDAMRSLTARLDTPEPDDKWAADVVEYLILKSEGKWDEAELLLNELAPKAEKTFRGNVVGTAKEYIDIYSEKGTLHEHLEVYERLVKELEHHSDERASMQLHAASLMQDGETRRKLRRADEVLQGILPASVYDEVTRTGEVVPRYFPMAVLFLSDFAGFTKISAALTPRQVIDELSDIFAHFDEIMERNGCEPIETIGDGYLAVAGLAVETTSGSRDIPGGETAAARDNAGRMGRASLEILDYLAERNARTEEIGGTQFQVRIGLHAGPIVGGLVGRRRLRYGVFGDPVNTVSRFEAACVPGRVTVSESVHRLLATEPESQLELNERDGIEGKGKGSLRAWELRWCH